VRANDYANWLATGKSGLCEELGCVTTYTSHFTNVAAVRIISEWVEQYGFKPPGERLALASALNMRPSLLISLFPSVPAEKQYPGKTK
jgi:hypothetical protein